MPLTEQHAGEMWVEDLEDLLAEPDEPGQEAEYRRGYRDGFIEALNALEHQQRRGGWQRAHDAAYSHWEGPLAEWARGDCTTLVLPPQMGDGHA